MTGPTIGTHNLWDEEGRVTLFADAVGYTEAIAVKVRERVRVALSGYAVRVCKEQPDLAFVARRDTWKIDAVRYVHVHAGIAGVTPSRGTFVIETRRRASGWLRRPKRPEVFLVPHRINAGFPPYVRGEGRLRADLWHRHAQVDADLVREYRARGFRVHALGDVNTPRGVVAFEALPWEVGSSFDRIASTLDLTEVEYLGHAGSDHPRLRARLAR